MDVRTYDLVATFIAKHPIGSIFPVTAFDEVGSMFNLYRPEFLTPPELRRRRYDLRRRIDYTGTHAFWASKGHRAFKIAVHHPGVSYTVLNSYQVVTSHPRAAVLKVFRIVEEAREDTERRIKLARPGEFSERQMSHMLSSLGHLSKLCERVNASMTDVVDLEGLFSAPEESATAH